MMTVADILEQVKQLSPDERQELIRLLMEWDSEPYFTLDELLTDITPDTLHGETSTGEPVGKEVW